MLMRFNVTNFLSFNKTQEFSMIAGKVRSKMEHIEDDNKVKLLKFAAIYGANAAGKSNLINAIDFASRVIVLGLPDGHTTKYCKISDKNKNASSTFEFEIKLGDKYYAYGFDVILTESKIVSEWLVEIMPDGNDKEIYKREPQKVIAYINKKYFKSNDINKRLEIYAEDTKGSDSILFLSEMNRNKDDLYKTKSEYNIFKDVYNWFENQLDVNFPDKQFSSYSYFLTNSDSDKICEIISAFGTGIVKFNIVEASIEKLEASLPKGLIKAILSKLEKERAKAKKNGDENPEKSVLVRGNKEFFIIERNIDNEIKAKTIEFEHKNISALFNLSEESDGTVRILELIELLFAENNNKIYVIDEIDRCLHPQLTYKLVESYLNSSKDRSTQLIVTTHESRLMDFDLLRRDEIWFVNKNSDGSSAVYSLDEYNERFDKKIDKAYLEGRYGGVPIFTSVFPLKGE